MSVLGPRTARGLAAALERWYRRSRRDLPWRRTCDPYAVWVSESMLQQTQVATVVPYYERFLAALPTVEALAGASEERVLALWSGLGYYRRARSLHRGAREVLARFGGRIPEDAGALLSLPGVGRYTAGAIASIAFGRREPVLDGNVRRVLSRILGRRGPGAREERALWEAAGTLVRAAAEPGDLNQGLMELGALVCAPRAPRCDACPLARRCEAHESGAPESYPAPKPRRAPVRVRVAAGLVEDGGRLLLVRRLAEGPLRGVWDVPALEVDRAGDAAAALRAHVLERCRIRVRIGERVGIVRHSILHRRLEVEIWRCAPASRARPATEEARWVEAARLDDAAVSGATRKIAGAAQSRSQGGAQVSSVSASRRRVSGSGSSGRSKR